MNFLELKRMAVFLFLIGAGVLLGCKEESEEAPPHAPAPSIVPTPAVPSDVIATAAGFSEVDLAWRDNSSDETSFVIERKVGSGSYAVLDTLGENEETYTDLAVEIDTTYTYRIRGCNGGGCSDWAESNAVTTEDIDAPTAPSSLSATTISSSRIDLSWTGSTDNVAVTEYAVFRGGVEIAQVSAPTTTYSNTGLSEATSYSYTVKARDAAGNLSSASNTASATTSDATAPSAPSSLSATTISSSRIDLSWTASTDNVAVTEYAVFRGGVEIAQVSAPTTTYSNTGLSEATSYSYTVKARDAAGNLSSASNTASATTSDVTAPTAPSSLSATAISSSRIDLSWTASTDNVAVTEYAVFRGGVEIAQVSAPTTTYSNTGLSEATSYSYTVKARDAAGNLSSASNTASATTSDVTAPTAPSSLSATAVSSSQINLSWTGSTDNVAVTEYAVFRAGVEIAQVSAPTTTYSNTGLSESTSYSYTVKARDAASNLSSASNTASATTSANAPNAPTNLVATVINDIEVDLTWTDGSSNETSFEIQRKTGAGSFGALTSPAANATSYNDASLTGETSYTYRIRACSSGGCSSYATSSQVTTAPNAPTNVIAVPSANGSGFTVSWTNTSSQPDWFYIDRHAEDWESIDSGIVSPYTDPVSDASWLYTYRVYACDDNGNCSRKTSSNDIHRPSFMVDFDSSITPLIGTAGSFARNGTAFYYCSSKNSLGFISVEDTPAIHAFPCGVDAPVTSKGGLYHPANIGIPENWGGDSLGFHASWSGFDGGSISTEDTAGPDGGDGGNDAADLGGTGPASKISTSQDPTNDPEGEFTFGVWLKASSGSRTVTLRLRDEDLTNDELKEVTVTTDWNLYTVSHKFVNGQSQIVTEIFPGNTSSYNIKAWGPRLYSVSVANDNGEALYGNFDMVPAGDGDSVGNSILTYGGTEFTNSTNQHSIAGWFYLPNYTTLYADKYIFVLEGAALATRIAARVNGTSGKLQVMFDGISDFTNIDDGSSLIKNAWNHLVVVANGNGSSEVFVNGVSIYTGDFNPDPFQLAKFAPGMERSDGNRPEGQSNWIDGKWTYYNGAALDSNEVAVIYAAEAPDYSPE